MNKLLKYILPAIFTGIVIAGAVNAQVTPPNYFKKVGSNVYPVSASTTLGTSSVNGAFKNLNISGTCTGCGGGSVTSTNGLVNSGNVTSTSFTSTSTQSSDVQVVNSEFYVGPGMATVGCAGSSTANDLSSCINAWLTLKQGVVSSTRIHINVPIPQANWQNTVNINKTGLFVNIDCPTGNPLMYGGSGTAILWDDGNPAAHVNQEMHGCLLMGHNTLIAAAQANTATTTGINCGGVNGCVNVNFHDMTINGFGRDFAVSSGTATSTNAYMLSLNNIELSGGNCGGNGMLGCLLYIGPAQNSGERFVATELNATDPGNSTSGNAIYISDGASASTLVTDSSLDNVQTYVGFSNGSVSFCPVHVENAAPLTYGSYIPFYATSSAATQLVVCGEIANDATTASTTFNTIIKHGVHLVIPYLHINNYNGQTITTLADHSLNNGSETETVSGVSVQSGALTNLVNNQTYSDSVGASTVITSGNSWPFAAYIDSANIVHLRNGGGDQATFGSTGVWTFSNNSTAGGPYNFFGNINATGTITALNGFFGGAGAQSKWTAAAGASYGVSVSTGGVVNIDASASDTEALVLNSSNAQANANLFQVNCSNDARVQGCQTIQGHGTSTSPLNVKSWSQSKGGIKVDQMSTTSDSNASALSLDVGGGGGGTAAQGLFIDATNGGTSGPIINARDNGKELVKVVVNASSTTSSTISFGSANVATCLALEDSTGTTKWYLSIIGGVLQATSTKPGYCP